MGLNFEEQKINRPITIITTEFDKDHVLSDQAYEAIQRVEQPGFLENATKPIKYGFVTGKHFKTPQTHEIKFLTADKIPMVLYWIKGAKHCLNTPSGINVTDYIKIIEENGEIADIQIIDPEEFTKQSELSNEQT